MSGGRGKGRGRSTPAATVTQPGQPKEGHTTIMSQSRRTPTNVKWSHVVIPLRPLKLTKLHF